MLKKAADTAKERPEVATALNAFRGTVAAAIAELAEADAAAPQLEASSARGCTPACEHDDNASDGESIADDTAEREIGQRSSRETAKAGHARGRHAAAHGSKAAGSQGRRRAVQASSGGSDTISGSSSESESDGDMAVRSSAARPATTAAAGTQAQGRTSQHSKAARGSSTARASSARAIASRKTTAAQQGDLAQGCIRSGAGEAAVAERGIESYNFEFEDMSD